MTKLETLYNSIRGLKELGLPLNEETRGCVQVLAQNPAFSAEWAQIQQVAMAKYERAVKDIAMN